MKKWFDYSLSLNNLRKAFNFGVLYQSATEHFGFELLENIPGKNILVLAPHPDDDVFGLGGTLIKLVKARANIHIVYFYNGSRGNIRRVKDKSLIAVRKQEAQQAAKITGVGKLIFWGFEDDKAIVGKSSMLAVTNLIKDFQPEVVFLPSFWDNHPDHHQVCQLFAKVLQQMPDFKAQLYLYEIWTPIFINRLVNITAEAEKKTLAVRAYQSQLQSRPYDEAILALNKYRADMLGKTGFAEGFFACSPKVFLEIYKKLI